MSSNNHEIFNHRQALPIQPALSQLSGDNSDQKSLDNHITSQYDYYDQSNTDVPLGNGVIFEEAVNSMMLSKGSSPSTPSAAIASVTNHFRISPIPIHRRASPTSSSSNSSNVHVSSKESSVEAQLRIQAAETRSNHLLEHESVFAYLGEELSVHNRDPFLNDLSSPGSSEYDEAVNYLRHHRPYMRRAVSLEWLSRNAEGNNSRPCMIQLPVFNHEVDIVDLLTSITVEDWVMPYIVSYLRDHALEYFTALPKLFDIKDYNQTPTTTDAALEDSDAYYEIFPNSFDDIKTAAPNPPTYVTPQFTRLRQRSVSDARIFEHHHRPVPIRPHELVRERAEQFSGTPLSSTQQPRARSTSPSLILDSPVTCRCLGLLYCNRDPTWTPWDMRLVYLLDNYLYEVSNDNEEILGYCPLSGAVISRETCSTSQIPGHDHSQTAALSIKCLMTCSAENANLRSLIFYLRPLLEDDIDVLETVIRRAVNLTIEDVYVFAKGSETETLLGRGRFNEVRKAKRRVPPVQPLPATSSTAAPTSSKGQGIAMIYPPNKAQLNISASSPPSSSGLPLPTGSPPPSAAATATATAGVVESASPYIALKIISKEIFHERVLKGKERADSLVREVIAQASVCRYIANLSNRIKSIDSKLSFLSSNSSSLVHEEQLSTSLVATAIFPVVQIFGVFESFDGFAIELELMQQLDLYEVLSQDGVFHEDSVKHIVKQLVTAALYCLKSGITHRDIKPSNITFSIVEAGPSVDPLPAAVAPAPALGPPSSQASTPPLPFSPIRIKLADFGMAGFISSHDRKVRGRCGTPGYVAPDILRAGVNESYPTNIDIFSIGVVAYVLLCGYEPFYGTDDHQLIQSNRNVDYAFHEPEWGKVSDDAKDWIAKALHPYAEQRIKLEDALKHPWLHTLPALSIKSSHSSAKQQQHPPHHQSSPNKEKYSHGHNQSPGGCSIS
jgi:serine/threonine protein kinase